MQAGCNKCKFGKPADGDSWCLGCSSLEIAQQHLRRGWNTLGLRAIAEENALNCARTLRALVNLDSTLGSGVAGSRPLQTSAKSKAESHRSRSPRDERPPIRRLPPPPKAPARESRRERDCASEYTYEDESEEEEEPRTEDVKEEPDPARESRRSERPPEPPYPPRGHPEPPRKRKKRKNRGGTKHQRRHRDAADPYRRSHRKLDQARLELAENLEAGLERRA